MKNNTKNNEQKKELSKRIGEMASFGGIAVIFTAVGYLSALIDIKK